MFCKNCGEQISDNAVVCIKCGVAVGNNAAQKPAGVNSSDAPSFGFAVLGFLWPLLGLILYLIWNKEYPQKAKSCGKGALIGFITNIIIGIIFSILMFTVGIDFLNEFLKNYANFVIL